LHLNEGHSGFAVLEADPHAHGRRGTGVSTQAAAQIPREVSVHHPHAVPAGHDRFRCDLIEEHLGPLREQLGLSRMNNLMALGRENPKISGISA
jgi:starch phosphorylase